MMKVNEKKFKREYSIKVAKKKNKVFIKKA